MRDLGEGIRQEFERRNYGKQLENMRKEVLQDPEVRKFLSQHREEIDEAEVNRSLSKLYEFHEALKQRREGKEPKMKHYLPELFMNVNYIDLRYTPTEEFENYQRQLERKKRIELIGVPKSMREATFEEIYNENTPAAHAIYNFLDLLQRDPNHFHKAPYIHGAFGVGKTFLMATMANFLADQGQHIIIANVTQLIPELREAIGTGKFSQKMERLKKVQGLILDDIGAEENTAWLRDEVLMVLLQYRMTEELWTGFTSNLDLKGLTQHYAVTKDSIEEIKASRLIERIRYLSTEVELSGPNLRNV